MTEGYSIRSRGTLRAGIALLGFTLAACGGGGGEEVVADSEILLAPDELATATVQTIRSGVTLTGNLNPYRIVEVKAQVPGLVRMVAAEEGQAVSQGEVLARIEAEGITSQAAGARSAVAAAEANLALAERQLESARTLYEAGAMSEIELRTSQAQLEAAQSQLASAVAQATGAVEQAQRTTVQSPISGQVSAKSVNAGEAVSPGQTLFTVVNSGFLELQGQVPVDEAATVREGHPVVFTLDAYPGQEFRGTVARVSPVADPGTRQVGVVMRLPNEGGALIGGLFASGRVLTDAETSGVAVPIAAVRGSDGDRHVLVVEDGVIVHRPVVVGPVDQERGLIAIRSGVEPGETVVTAPGAIMPGFRVVTEAAPSSRAVPAAERDHA